MGGGGKGSSGKVEFAAYLEDVHEDWLGVSSAAGDKVDNSIVDVMNSLFSTSVPATSPNPYTLAAALDSSDLVSEILTQARKTTSVSGYLNSDLDHSDRPNTAENEWLSMINAAQDVADNSIISKEEESITSLVESIFTVAVANATAATLQTITDSKTNVDTIVDGAIEKALSVINSQLVKDSIEVFSESLNEETNIIKSRFSAGMAEANATMSSAFIFGNSNIENSRIRAIERFTTDLVNRLYNQVILSYISSAMNLSTVETQSFSNLFNANLQGQIPFKMQRRQVRDARLDAGTQLMSNMLFANINNELAVPQMYKSVLGTAIVARDERVRENLRIDAEEKMWDLKVYNAGVSVLGGMNTGGGTFVPESASQGSSAVAGAIGGAITGAQIGALEGAKGAPIFGPAGAAIGAGIGLVLGGIAGFNE